MIDEYGTDASGDQADSDLPMVAVERMRAGLVRRLEAADRDTRKQPDDAGALTAAAIACADWAIQKNQQHIAAALRRAGIDVDEAEGLNVRDLLPVLSARAEVVIDDITPEAITDAVLRAASARISRELGFQVELSAETDWRQVALNAAMQAVVTGRPNRIINGAAFGRLQLAAAASGVGMSPADRRRMQNRMAQRRYRQRNRQVWYRKGELP